MLLDVLLFLIGAVLGGALVRQRWPRISIRTEVIEKIVEVEVFPEPWKRPGFIQLQLVSEKGKPLGGLGIAARQRKPTLLHGGNMFVVERQVDEGTWLYRRVGRERA